MVLPDPVIPMTTTTGLVLISRSRAFLEREGEREGGRERGREGEREGGREGGTQGLREGMVWRRALSRVYGMDQ